MLVSSQRTDRGGAEMSEVPVGRVAPSEAPRRDDARGWPATLVWAGVALLAAHAMTDAIIAPEAGVGRPQHVPEALVVAAALAFAALGVKRMRAGAIAALALALVPPALLGFGLAVADSAARGAHGDDWTGFLLLPAAVALLAGGATLLRRSRRRDGHVVVRRVLAVVGAIVFLYVVEGGVLMALYATHR